MTEPTLPAESVAVQRARQIADERRRLAQELGHMKCPGCRRMATERQMDEFKAALIDGLPGDSDA